MTSKNQNSHDDTPPKEKNCTLLVAHSHISNWEAETGWSQVLHLHGLYRKTLTQTPPPPKWNYPSLFLKGHDLVHPDLKQLELYIWSKTIQLNLTLGLLLEEVEHRGFDLEAAKSKEVNMECSGQAEVSSLRANYQSRQEHTEMERCD